MLGATVLKIATLLALIQLCHSARPVVGKRKSAPLNPLDVKFLDTINPWLDKLVSLLAQQPNANENGTRADYKELLLTDTTNDDLQSATIEEIVRAAGFLYERHKVVTIDHYVTHPVRIVNPLVKRSKLRKIPVVFVHGGSIDIASFIWSSIRQHHPEKWPRTRHDRHITSSNRSLPFVLANHGYDVWLITSRGSNRQNQGHLVYKTHMSPITGPLKMEAERMKYWDFSMDEIVDLELPKQIDKILEVSKAKKVSVVALSIGTQVTMSMLASNKRHANKVHTFVAFGPPYSSKGLPAILKNAFARVRFVQNQPLLTLSTLILTEFIFGPPLHNLVGLLAKDKKLRYAIIPAMSSLLMGPSQTYKLFLEQPVFGHLLMPTSTKLAFHFTQQVLAGKLQRYDYGKAKNLIRYKSIHPRVYDISNLHIKAWLVVAGSNDRIAPMESTHQMVRDVIKPKASILEVVNHNHLGLVCGVDNDVVVNLPVLKWMDKYH